jgi:beta-mannosidase
MDLAKEYGPIRNLADFVRKAQLANYVAFRAMYESRNSGMFERTTGVLTWMSHPAQPSFVWQLYHYDLEPNSSLYAVQKAAEMVHVQMNEADRSIEVINNLPADLRGLTITQTTYQLDGRLDRRTTAAVDLAPASSAKRVYVIAVNPHISKVYFVKLDLTDATGKLLSTNFYWQNVAQDDFEDLANLPVATLEIEARPRVEGEKTIFEVTVANPGSHVALMAHLQLHRGAGGKRVLPVFYSDNYLSLAPGETRSLTIEAASQEVAGGAELLVDGYNIAVKRTYGEVPVMLNQNAQPLEWPASGIVAPALGGGR